MAQDADQAGVAVQSLRERCLSFARGITGTLVLNRDNPEDFLFRIEDAKIGEPE